MPAGSRDRAVYKIVIFLFFTLGQSLRLGAAFIGRSLAARTYAVDTQLVALGGEPPVTPFQQLPPYLRQRHHLGLAATPAMELRLVVVSAADGIDRRTVGAYGLTKDA